VAEKCELQQIAVVKQGRDLGDAPCRVGRRSFHHQRFGCNAKREYRAEGRFPNGGAQSVHGSADRRMLRRVQRPVPPPGERRSRQLQQAARELR